jgi:hypothetical protein
MWGKGIRFGIDIAAVRARSRPASERVMVASRLEPVPGIDAHIIEVSDDIHRSDAPRQLANGKLDLMCFQNRFPQIQKGVRLLQKLPRVVGTRASNCRASASNRPPERRRASGRWPAPAPASTSARAGEFLVARAPAS